MCLGARPHLAGKFVVQAERFPRIEKLDMSVDFGALKNIFKFMDHKMLISPRDTVFQQPEVLSLRSRRNSREKPERRKRWTLLLK